MPNYDSLRLRNQRLIDQRLTQLHRQLAETIGNIILRAASADGKIANSTPVREALRLRIWESAIKPLYVGSGTDALIGAEPQSPYAALLVDGITVATRIQAERQAAIVRRVCSDKEVVAWLTGPRDAGIVTAPLEAVAPLQLGGIALNPDRGILGGLRGPDGRIDVARAQAALVKPAGAYEPFHAWVDPRGYRLSDRIWNTSVEVRARVDHLLSYHIASGTSAVDIAKIMEPFLTPGGRLTKTKTPYGTEGSYAARRLARTEITAAAGRATVNASIANPFVGGVQWRTSGSHPKPDDCDDKAHGGPNGDGIYAPDKVPQYPSHPHCRCVLLPVPMGSVDDLVATLRADIQAAKGNLIDAVSVGDAERGQRLRGLLNPERMTQALLDGTLDTTVADAVSKSAQRLPQGVRARARAKVVAPSTAKPISQMVSSYPDNARVAAAAKDALSAIESVHGVGDMPPIPIEVMPKGSSAYGEYNRGIFGDTEKIQLADLNTEFGKKSMRLTAVHETGHWIDARHLNIGILKDIPGPNDKPVGINPIAADYLNAVNASAHIKRLQALKAGTEKILVEGKRRKADAGFVNYLSRKNEVWARAYAQYIAVKSKDPALLEALRFHQSGQMRMQWDDEDFAPIEKAIDQMFRTLGWLP